MTDCSHSGICNIIEYAKDLIGGFYLQSPSVEQIEGPLTNFERLHARRVHACLCTDLAPKISLAKVADRCEVGVGMELED